MNLVWSAVSWLLLAAGCAAVPLWEEVEVEESNLKRGGFHPSSLIPLPIRSHLLLCLDTVWSDLLRSEEEDSLDPDLIASRLGRCILSLSLSFVLRARKNRRKGGGSRRKDIRHHRFVTGPPAY